MKKVKSIIMQPAVFFLVTNGFSVNKAKLWTGTVLDDLIKNKKYSISKKLEAYRKGYMPQCVDMLDIKADDNENYISEHDYLYLEPINGIYEKWISNKVSARKVFYPFKEYLQKQYYQIGERFGETTVTVLDDCESSLQTTEALAELIRDKKSVSVVHPVNSKSAVVSFEDGNYSFDGETVENFESLLKCVKKFNKEAIIAEYIHEADTLNKLAITVYNEDDGAVVCEALIKTPDGSMYSVNIETGIYVDEKGNRNEVLLWDDIKALVAHMSDHAPQLELFNVEIILNGETFKIVKIDGMPDYPYDRRLSKETVDFLKGKLLEKKANYNSLSKKMSLQKEKIGLKTRQIFAALFFPKGLMPYLSTRWIQEVCKDFFQNRETSLRKKLWAYKKGFLSYRIDQYGITKENMHEHISDFEYKWLRHINNENRVWFEDKITYKYILSGFSKYLPEYYYYINTRNGINKVVPMMDCLNKEDRSFESIFELAKVKGALALKPDEGSHGDGFYKLSYENDEFYLNGKNATVDEALAILKNPDNQYLITEYINNHSQFKQIYSGAVNTIRMIVFKDRNNEAQIGNAYMRFGSKKTGAVDNMGAGGMFVQVDIDTGKYGNAKIITNNSIKPCPNHPDTGVLMEGYIPHWDIVKEAVLEVADDIKQLEYFGFDIAITEDSLKFPEINRFPDYPKIEQLSKETMRYLLYKLEDKKRLFGYDKKPCRKLIHLPNREK